VDESVDELVEATAIGLLRDVPLCRLPWTILPFHQHYYVVREMQYTLMFESLLATPGPHYYVHLELVDGTNNLGFEEYALRPGSKSALTGTLMRVVSAQREPDVSEQ
jgi:hypothetical protein